MKENFVKLQACPGGQVPVINEPSRQKTCIQEQWERNGQFDLTSIDQETYEKYFYGSEHWNYFTQDEDLGPVILSLKQETSNGRDQFRYVAGSLLNLCTIILCITFPHSKSLPRFDCPIVAVVESWG